MKNTLITLIIISFSFTIFSQSEFLQKGIDAFEKGEYKSATKFLKKEVKKNPNNAEAYFYLGLTKNSEDLNKGIEEFDKAIEINPNFSEAYGLRGTIKSHKNDEKGALSDYSKAIELDPNNFGNYFNRAWLLESSGDYKNALQDCFKSIELNPDVPTGIYLVIAHCKFNLGEQEEALKYCDGYIESSGDFYGYREKGILKFKMKDFKGALEDFNLALKAEFGSEYTYEEIGKTKLELNDKIGAKTAFDKAVELGVKIDLELFEKCK
jgi:tetratricopeptide (TPR) repeat protein